MSASSWKKARFLKRTDRTLVSLSLSGKKLTSKELARKLKDTAGVD